MNYTFFQKPDKIKIRTPFRTLLLDVVPTDMVKSIKEAIKIKFGFPIEY